ncbi:hypothetical protein MAPG_08758 [Magnaporthiopsis poae ATCC 64411]|uniref:Retinol dehydrogenase 8 n=1 Tax=Magnaporthiopsis poae (strain ATCC 64411 / 73-15) TaxID=644358 RepID=A0A0C4E868_MAGP6|nr:hypothetical protein MAPG_08758 [Magnaporthiopsis poae ATCC 64411]
MALKSDSRTKSQQRADLEFSTPPGKGGGGGIKREAVLKRLQGSPIIAFATQRTATMSAAPATKFTTPKRPLTFLVTGCSSGIGLELCRAVQAAGHRLIATSRYPARTPELVAEVESRGGRWLPLDQLTEGEVRDQFETVFFGPYRLIRAAVAHMRRRRFGVILNVSSGAGIEAMESMGVYGAAKAALDGLSKTLSTEVKDFNVRVIVAHLGTFRTNMSSAVRRGTVPLADDYKGKAVDQTIQWLASGSFVGHGDPAKAARVMVEVATGTGVGEGHEDELYLPLGREIPGRYEREMTRLGHALDVFKDVTCSLGAED